MINALITGSIVTDPRHGTSQSGVEWANCVVRVPCGQNKETGDSESAFVQVACFGSEAQKLSRLGKGDALSATGPLKPTVYQKDGQERHGLSLTAQEILTAYGIAKKRPESRSDKKQQRHDTQAFGRLYKSGSELPFDDALTF